MARHEHLRPDDRLWDLIAVELRRQREWHKETQDTLGVILDVTKSTVARYESGEIPLPRIKAEILDDFWGLEGLFAALVRHAKRASVEGWWETFLAYERESVVIRAYDSTLVPGIIQREGYMRDLFVSARRPDITDAIAERLKRQEVLSRPTPPVLHVLLDPAVLVRDGATPEAFRDQLAYLLALADQPNVFLRVVGASPRLYTGLGGPITIVTAPRGDLALIGSRLDGSITISPEDVQKLSLEFDQISAESLPLRDSRQCIADILERPT